MSIDTSANRRPAPFPLVDVLTWRFSLRGSAPNWRDDDLHASGLSMIHLTAGASQVLDFAPFCDGIIETLEVIEQNPDRLFLVKSADDFDKLGKDGRIGVMLGLQNSGSIGTVARRVEMLWQLGIRVMQLTYNDSNLLGDGCLEERNGGLSQFGRDVVAECNRSGVLLDVSHAAPGTAADVLARSRQPVVASHSSRRVWASNPRNIPDEVLLAVARSGGVVGVPAWGPLLWDGKSHTRPSIRTFTDAVVGMIDLLGEDAVAVGTDLPLFATGTLAEERAVVGRMVQSHPGAFAQYVAAFGDDLRSQYCADFDNIGLWHTVPAALAEAGLSQEVIAKVVGGNWMRVCRTVWATRERILP
ncbi:MAG: membrane dipeptidase [Sphingobium sp.]